MDADDAGAIRTFIESRFMRSARHTPGDGDPLFSSGIIDSFGVLELIAFLEDTFKVTIDPAVHSLDEFDSIDRIVQLLHRARGAAR